VPPEVHCRIQNLSSISSGQLDAIAETYQPLFDLYRKARLVMTERSKSPLPDVNLQAENYTDELKNLADEISPSPNPSSTIRGESSKLDLLRHLLNLVQQSKT
jgi:hypothetical protein